MTKQKVFRKYSKLEKHLPTTKALFEGPEQKYESYCQMTWYHNQNVICYSQGKLVGIAKELVRIKHSFLMSLKPWLGEYFVQKLENWFYGSNSIYFPL